MGEVIDTPKGSHGFGYDPYFYLPTYSKTAAELDPSMKNQISHRALAMQELLLKMSHEY
jgi:XTP/dITP diphosphohydrolase